ncbi:response regulator [Granulicella sp. L46]|uniref:response regulator n=1 Tax=Granulicella sp. L46 TaxID=1641865 RepID=UPI00131BE1EB|nr:HD domain-containing phosphohydrolase [Granulicella sp. L46]
MKPRILLVDDEPAVLAGYERTLRQDFEVQTAVSGELGLKALREDAPYAVVVSDMRMPVMSGSQFLAQAKVRAPDTVRMLLTGYTDIDAAMAAINEGNIFRFLTKPCSKDTLTAALNAGVGQNNLIRSEKELLEKTLLGCIKALADLLSASSPEAFGRSMRIVHIVRHIAASFTFAHGWRLEAAAMLSQLGCVTLDTDVIQQAFVGMKLSLEDQVRFDAHPMAAMKLLSEIPRLEPVAWIIGNQLSRDIPREIPGMQAESVAETVLGARILKLAVAYNDLRIKRLSEESAIESLGYRDKEFDRELIDALIGIKAEGGEMISRRLAIPMLATGMFLDQEVRNREGMLLAGKGQEISRAVLLKIQNWAQAGLIDHEVTVLAPL